MGGGDYKYSEEGDGTYSAGEIATILGWIVNILEKDCKFSELGDCEIFCGRGGGDANILLPSGSARCCSFSWLAMK